MAGLKRKLQQKLAAVVAGSRLTLAGEVVVMRDGMAPMDAETVTALGLTDVLEGMRDICPDMQVRVANGLSDVTLKLFVCDGMVDAAAFYEHTRALLEACAERVCAEEEMSVRINVTGTLQHLGESEEFRFLNKRDIVSYKVTERDKGFVFLGGMREKITNKILPQDECE